MSISGARNQKRRSDIEMLKRIIDRKIARLLGTEDFIDSDELDALSTDLIEASSMMIIVADRSLAKSYYEQILKTSLPFLLRLNHRLDDCEETFHRYNIPRVLISGDEDDSVAEFMSGWRDEAEKARERGFKSLNEWLARLPNTEAFDHVRLAEINLGSRISYCIAECFVLIAESSRNQEDLFHRKISKVVEAIKCLRIEEDRSAVIVDKFLLAASRAEAELMYGHLGEILHRRNSVSSSSSSSAKTESDLVHLILREILRLEVAFSFPNLPMMLTENVFIKMADHLVCVFQQKLDRVRSVKKKLEEELVPSMEDYGDRRELGLEFKDLCSWIVEIWKLLDLSSLAPRMLA